MVLTLRSNSVARGVSWASSARYSSSGTHDSSASEVSTTGSSAPKMAVDETAPDRSGAWLVDDSPAKMITAPRATMSIPTPPMYRRRRTSRLCASSSAMRRFSSYTARSMERRARSEVRNRSVSTRTLFYYFIVIAQPDAAMQCSKNTVRK